MHLGIACNVSLMQAYMFSSVFICAHLWTDILLWQLNDWFLYIYTVYRNGFSYGLHHLCLASLANFFSQLFSCIPVIHGEFYLDQFMVIQRDIQLIHYRIRQTFLPEHDHGLQVVTFAA